MEIFAELSKRRFRMLRAVMFLLLILGAGQGFCGTAENLFLEANGQYEKGNYVEAEKIYRTIINYGVENEAVHYNLGNTYFKQGQTSEAILYYEKALKLDPRDSEAKQNLELANFLKYDRVEQNEQSPPLKLALWIHDLFSLHTQLVLALVLFYLSSFVLASLILRRRRGLTTDAIVLSLAILLFFLFVFSVSAGMKIYTLERSSYGIVIIEKVDVLSGPGETNAVLFPMHEGLKVRVRSVRDEWYQISLPNGLNGWVKKENIGII